jgi:hypothetical protein
LPIIKDAMCYKKYRRNFVWQFKTKSEIKWLLCIKRQKSTFFWTFIISPWSCFDPK